MREIKFRAWDKANVGVYNGEKDKKRMSYYGPSFTMDDNQNTLCFFTPEGKQSPYGDHNSEDRYELMQFTGLLDKNGKEIYEGDILKWSYEKDNGYVVSKGEKVFSIYYNPGTAEYKTSDGESMWGYLDSPSQLEVIGNVYENKELL